MVIALLSSGDPRQVDGVFLLSQLHTAKEQYCSGKEKKNL